MTVAKKQIKKVEEFLNKIDWAFHLNGFVKSIVMIEKQPAEHQLLTAEIIPDMIYQEITINLYPRFWESSPLVQAEALIHELLHTVLQETRVAAMDMLDGKLHTEKEIKDINEKTVSQLTHIVSALAGEGLEYFKKAFQEYIKNDSKKTNRKRKPKIPRSSKKKLF